MKIQAKVKPLNGSKHYGTEVSISCGGDRDVITVWIDGGGPSDAQLVEWELTRQEWDNNAEVDDGWGGTEPCRSSVDTSHYQSRLEEFIAYRIAQALNGLEWHAPA